MTPEQISTMTAIAALIKSMGTWPVLSLIMVGTLSPWVIMVMLAVSQHKRVEAQVRMYEDNVELVKKTINLAEGYRDQLIWSTQTVDRAVSIAKNNMYCPVVRKNARPKDIDG